MRIPRLRSSARWTIDQVRQSIVRVLYRSPAEARRALAPRVERGEHGLLRVHVGCGSIALPGWFNVDERWFPHVHLVGPANRLHALPDGAAEVLYASHVLEHLPHHETLPTLEEWSRVLAQGGQIFVAVPDFDRILERYLERDRQISEIEGPLMGEQDYQANTHRAVFNRARLAVMLERSGFSEIREFRGEEILGDGLWDNSKHAVSLNLAARKR